MINQGFLVYNKLKKLIWIFTTGKYVSFSKLKVLLLWLSLSVLLYSWKQTANYKKWFRAKKVNF